MNQKIIDCIPSATMRKYLTAHTVEMSALQQATIIFEYADKKKRISLLQSLLDETKNEAEKLLLSSAVKDLQCRDDWISDLTQEIYDKNFPREGFPLYPFLEICNLPVLFKNGDVIRWHGNTRYHGDFYYVGGIPLLIPGHCDFSDECYLCYSLSYPIKTEWDLLYCHEHIDVCKAERASIKKLTPQQKCNYNKIKKLLRIMKIRRLNKGWKWTLIKRLLH